MSSSVAHVAREDIVMSTRFGTEEMDGWIIMSRTDEERSSRRAITDIRYLTGQTTQAARFQFSILFTTARDKLSQRFGTDIQRSLHVNYFRLGP